MKIVQQTPAELTLRLRPVGLWIFGGIFAAAGLAVIVFLGRATTLTCRRVEPTQVSCELRESGLPGVHLREIPVSRLYGAEVETSTSSDGDTYRVVLLTSEGKVPFTDIYSSGSEAKQTTASHIETFVHTSEETLTAQDDSRWFAYPFGGIFVAAGLFVISTGQIVTCRFDKTLGSMTLKRQGLLGTKVTEHFIRQILDVWVEESTDSDGDCTYRVSFKLKSGDRLPLTSYYSSGKGDKQQTADRICTFLNLSR